MKNNTKKLILCIAIPLIVGGLSALFTMGQMKAFELVDKPPLSPPGWLFPIVWSILYILMGIASYLVLYSDEKQSKIECALGFYSLQLFFNFLWSILFFNLKIYYFSFLWLIALLILIIITTVKFYKINKTAGYLLIPYILWVIFAGYLNLGIAILN